ncbi:portal protein [Escherichia coli]
MTDWHRKVLCNFDNAWSATQDMREQIIEAQRFVRVSGAQWEGSTNAGYSFDEGRFEHYPRFELNKIARECDRIIGEYRQNRISVKFRPKDDKASEALAEKMNGKFRADYQETSGGEACDNAFDDAVTGGFGCFRMCADYEDEMDPSNEQRRISLLPVYDPATCVFFDQDSKQYDRSDAMWAMEMFSMTPKAFEAEYPDSIAASLSRDDTGTQYDWSTPDAIYVGRYYEVRIEKVKLTAWRNPVSGETAIYDEDQIKDIVDELTDGAFELIGERTVKKRRVYCGLLSGAEWLEEPKRIPGEHIPLIPVYGRRSFVDNQERIEGHAAKAMDAQRLENLMVSMIADNATQAGGDGIPVVDVDMIPGPLATHWAERNKKRPAFLPMVSLKNKNGDITAQAQVSSYTPPTQMPPALAGLLQYTGTAIQQITGAIPVELSHDDKKKLVAEYCQKNFVDKGMIADIAFHDLDSKNPHAHVMLTLKTIGPEGFGKKDRSWNDKKIMIQWRESWATMSNSYLEAAGSEERIDHRSLRTQCADALAQAEEAFSAEEKAFWLAKATETNRPAMQRVHRAKWNDKESQEQRATEQAQRDHQIEEAKKVYTTFSELPLEIVVDVRSFTITHLADPEEIVLPDYPATVEQQSIVATATTSRRPPVKSYRDPNKVSKVNVSGKKSPVLVAPEPTASTKLKTPYLQNTRAMNRAPVRSRKQTKPRQNGLFKRFTLLIVDFLKERFVWAKRKPDTTDADHDKRIAENYVYDEVLGVNVPRSEFEKRTKFNNGDYKLTSDEIKRFPSRPNQEQPEVNRSLDLTPSMPPEHMRQGSAPKLSPP